MALDASIYARFLQPPKSIDEFDREAYAAEGAKQANALNALRLAAGQRQEADAQRLLGEQTGVRNALSTLGSTATDEQRVNALRSLGTQTGLAQADALEKGYVERQAKRATIAKTESDVATDALKRYRGALDFIDTPQGAARWLQAQYSDPSIASHMQALGPIEQAVQRIPQDPAAFEQWRQRAGMGMEAFQKQLADREDKAASRAITVRGQDLTDERARSEGAAGRAVTMRGQNMADARSRETTAAAISKPFEVTGPDGTPVLVQQDRAGNIRPVEGYQPKQSASKPLTESQAKALLFATRMQESGKTIDELAAKGVKSPSLGQQLTGGEGFTGTIATALASPEQQQVDQAQRDFINAVLRRESGAAISSGEFANARKQYFAQPGDSQQVIAQKAKNRETAINGLFAEVPEGRRTSVAGAAPKQAAKPASGAPAVGTVQDGYRFKGGDPGDQKNWEKV